MQKVIVALAALTVVAAADPLRSDEVFVPGHRGPARPPVPPAPAKPAPEVATAGKLVAGTWKCTGAVDKLDIKLALDDAWVEWRVSGGAGTTLQVRTFDATAKQWTMLELTSATTHHEATSLGPDATGAWTWAIGDASREHETVAKDKLELWGERKVAAGWHKSYTATCQRAK